MTTKWTTESLYNVFNEEKSKITKMNSHLNMSKLKAAYNGAFGSVLNKIDISTKKVTPVPVILVGSEFWTGMVDWIKNTLLDEFHNISPKDMDLIPIMDDPDDVVNYINDYYSDKDHHLEPNYTM